MRGREVNLNANGDAKDRSPPAPNTIAQKRKNINGRIIFYKKTRPRSGRAEKERWPVLKTILRGARFYFWPMADDGKARYRVFSISRLSANTLLQAEEH